VVQGKGEPEETSFGVGGRKGKEKTVPSGKELEGKKLSNPKKRPRSALNKGKSRMGENRPFSSTPGMEHKFTQASRRERGKWGGVGLSVREKEISVSSRAGEEETSNVGGENELNRLAETAARPQKRVDITQRTNPKMKVTENQQGTRTRNRKKTPHGPPGSGRKVSNAARKATRTFDTGEMGTPGEKTPNKPTEEKGGKKEVST